MAKNGKRFLASVGYAEAFRKVNGEMKLAFVSKSLTDSGLSITTTKDDIRGGQGAPIQFSFFHDANVEITLTDVQWRPEYLESQLGVTFKGDEDHQHSYVTKTFKFEDGQYLLKGTDPVIVEMPFSCNLNSKYLAWGAPVGTENFEDIQVEIGGTSEAPTYTLKLANNNITGDYCVRYLAKNDKATIAEVTSQIIPDELYLVITAPIFAGDACSASHGKAAGSIQFEVPRFQLNGAQDFAMNMSSNQTMSLSGTAMAAPATECDAEGGRLLRIIHVDNEYIWTDDVVDLICDAESAEPGNHPSLYAVLKDGHLRKCADSDVEYKLLAATSYSDLTAGFEFAANNTYVFRLKAQPNASCQVVIGAAA